MKSGTKDDMSQLGFMQQGEIYQRGANRPHPLYNLAIMGLAILMSTNLVMVRKIKDVILGVKWGKYLLKISADMSAHAHSIHHHNQPKHAKESHYSKKSRWLETCQH